MYDEDIIGNYENMFSCSKLGTRQYWYRFNEWCVFLLLFFKNKYIKKMFESLNHCNSMHKTVQQILFCVFQFLS